jgi:hypothetical protein
MTILITSIKYRKGFIRVRFWAHSGIFSMGVNKPLIKIKITTMNQNTNMACCWVSVTEERKRPIPMIARIKMEAKAYKTVRLPAKGMLKI